MIATMVFSVILLLATSALLQVSRTYFKGVSSSQTQDVAQNIMTTITEAIQFSGGNIQDPIKNNGVVQGICVDKLRFSYVPNKSTLEGEPGLLVDHLGSSKVCDADLEAQDLSAPPPLLGREFLRPRMRITKLTVKKVPSTNLYRVSLGLAVGEDDQFDGDGNCKSTAGSQFCATTSLSTLVEKRVE